MVRVVEKGIFVTPPALFTEPSRTASLASSVEEIIPFQKRPWLDDKRKDKVDYHLSTIFDDVGLALARAQESFSVEELKVFPSETLYVRPQGLFLSLSNGEYVVC